VSTVNFDDLSMLSIASNAFNCLLLPSMLSIDFQVGISHCQLSIFHCQFNPAAVGCCKKRYCVIGRNEYNVFEWLLCVWADIFDSLSSPDGPYFFILI